MPRKNTSRLYVAEGFYNDCEELIQKCLRADIVNYHVFCNIWKDMNFAHVFWGRQLSAELAELSEEAIYVAKAYFVADNNNIEESIAGLFLVYGLLNIQPYPGFAPLRIIPDDIVAIKKIEMFARRTNRFDVLYILGSVLINGPVEYHAQIRDFGFERSIKKYLLGHSDIDMPSQRTTGVLSHRSEELDILREINSLTKKYSESKEILTKTGIWSEKLNYSNSALATELNASFKKVLAGTAYSEQLEEDVTERISEKDSYNYLQSIKNKAMAVTNNTAKHREGVEERKKVIEEKALKQLPSPKKSQKPERGRSKRKFSAKAIRRKRSKVEMSSDSDTDTIALASSDESDKLSQTSSVDETLDNETETAKKEINIQIESLPVLISMDRNKEYEFEIIDNMQTGTRIEDTTNKDPKINKNKRKINNGGKNDNVNNEPQSKLRKVLMNITTELEVPISNVSAEGKGVQETQTNIIEKKITKIANVKDNQETETAKAIETEGFQIAKDTEKQKPKKVKILDKQKDHAAKFKENQTSLIVRSKDKEETQTAKTMDKQKTQTAKVTDTLETPSAIVANRLETPTAIVIDRLGTQIAKVTDKRETPTAKVTDRLETTTAKVTDRLETATAKVTDRLETPTAKVTDRLETTTAKVIDRLETPSAIVIDRLETPTAKVTDRLETPTAKDKQETQTVKIHKRKTLKTKSIDKQNTLIAKTIGKQKTKTDKVKEKQKTQTEKAIANQETQTAKAIVKRKTLKAKTLDKLKNQTAKAVEQKTPIDKDKNIQVAQLSKVRDNQKTQTPRINEKKETQTKITSKPKNIGRKVGAKKSNIKIDDLMISPPKTTRSSMKRLSASSVNTG